jgi:hypothetical protein
MSPQPENQTTTPSHGSVEAFDPIESVNRGVGDAASAVRFQAFAGHRSLGEQKTPNPPRSVENLGGFERAGAKSGEGMVAIRS